VTFTIASYNIQIPTVKTEFHSWSSRKKNLLELLPTLGDVIALQEVSYCETRQGHSVSECLQAHGFEGYEPALMEPQLFPDEFHHRVPIFWKKDKFRVINANMRLVSTGTPEEQELFPNMENRYCSHVKLQALDTGEIFHVFNVHQQHVVEADLSSIVEYVQVQKKSLSNLEAYVANEVNGDELVFAVGDYNMPSPGLDGLAPASKLAAERKNAFYNSYHGYRTPLPEEGKNIDHILTNAEPSDVLLYQTVLDFVSSDHNPIQTVVAAR
jgi:endonuclease/exonuclease/phosphatase family metal-dependent hydrolase